MSTVLTVILVVVAVIVAGVVISIYNSLIRLKNLVNRAWANIDVALKQRNDEIPNLVNTVKGYQAYEQETLEQLTELRSLASKASTPKENAAVDNQLSETLRSMFAVAEDYPDLKANQSFIALQSRLSEIEDLIADRREFYNDQVTTYNTRISQIPYLFFTGPLGYEQKELFEADDSEKALPEVSV